MSEEVKVKILTKDEILGADDREVKVIEVPEWGGAVRIIQLSGEQRDNFDSRLRRQSKGLIADLQKEFAHIKNPKQREMAIKQRAANMGSRLDLKGLKAYLVSLAIVDEDNERLFSEEEVEALNKKSGTALERVYNEVQALNGMGEEAEKELEKNSGSDQNEKPGSGSPDKSEVAQ